MSSTDIPDMLWRKSSHSNGQANCLETAATRDGVVVRDSKAPEGPRVTFTVPAWRRFTDGLKAAPRVT
jgi:Domain of unknown function (DUF397)